MGGYPGHFDVFAPSCLISYATLNVLSELQALEGWSNHFTIFIGQLFLLGTLSLLCLCSELIHAVLTPSFQHRIRGTNGFINQCHGTAVNPSSLN